MSSWLAQKNFQVFGVYAFALGGYTEICTQYDSISVMELFSVSTLCIYNNVVMVRSHRFHSC